jgi:aminoglycoside 3-N-acetyltransferase
MLGCGLLPNTSMHAIEEVAQVPYLLKSPMQYSVQDEYDQTIQKTYAPHNFQGWTQRYDRVESILSMPELKTGKVLKAESYLIDASALKHAALSALQQDPYFFVDPNPTV